MCRSYADTLKSYVIRGYAVSRNCGKKLYTEAATFFPMSAIVKPMLEERAYRKAGMPDYQNVETIAAIQ